MTTVTVNDCNSTENLCGIRPAVITLGLVLLGLSLGVAEDVEENCGAVSTSQYNVTAELESFEKSFWGHSQLFVWKERLGDSTQDMPQLLLTDPRNARRADLSLLQDSLLSIGIRYGDSVPPHVRAVVPLWKNVETLELWDGNLRDDLAADATILHKLRDSLVEITVWKYPNMKSCVGVSVCYRTYPCKARCFVLGALDISPSFAGDDKLVLSIRWNLQSAVENICMLLPEYPLSRGFTLTRCEVP